ncbi:hypothetical protein HYH02_013582 [Chlamydomonas schloesseri]|uniref:Peptidase S8/S53 domain-containing protein n=1 Tax=Chlamydomonas schloesseri TaxID=2026947 RepID=A0A835SVR0_9CHLO|nr:hypothetical protein HYH02_013582 [Chlamydomonas schloesseri]|eukprot:KAG2430743.1 hypothetical protein HYH02_013582 [Chlamydomonas schloesseri]
MALSNLQILEAVDESVLQIVLDEVRKRTDVDFVVRDFVLKAPTDIVTDPSASSSGRRRLQQTYALNDPQLSSTWWFDRINVTGAWRLLGVNSTDPQQKTSDVVIGVTDSGAFVLHPDLIGSFWENPGEIDGDLRDNDNNTFVDDVYGACFANTVCSPTSLNSNLSRCGIGRDTYAWNGVTDYNSHGTKIAGVIGARPNNGIGLAGVAPNLRQMILKVVDDNYFQYAYSDVVRAIDYGYAKGARIFSMSFGQDARTSATPTAKPSLDAAATAYRNLFTKYSNALFVAAAGNEWTSLEGWRSGNYTYSPCMVATDNTLCVGGTNVNDTIFYVFAMNQQAGTNFGLTSVDMGAPAHGIYTTDITFRGNYSSPSGTSFATPMVAAVAGLVLSALGGTGRATPQTPLQIKNILMSSGDLLPSLTNQFKSARRLNAANAVAAALTLARTNRTTVARELNGTTPAAVGAFTAMQAWEYIWYSGKYTDGAFDNFDPTFRFLDYYVRLSSNMQIGGMRYGGNTKLLVTSHMRVETPGMYGLQVIQSGITNNLWQMSIGENIMYFRWANATTGYVDLFFPDPGFYNITIWMYPDFSTNLDFKWQTPTDPNYLNRNWFWILSFDPPSAPVNDPNVADKPALWHVAWNEDKQFDTWIYQLGYFIANKNIRLYRDWQTTVPDFNFATGADLQAGLYGSGNVTMLNPANYVVYGYARTNLAPRNYSQGVAFRLRGPHTRLYINGQLVYDFQSTSVLQTNTPCVTLASGQPHEIYFYFAAMLNSTAPVGIQWANCTSPNQPVVTSTNYVSFSSALATKFFYNPNPNTVASLPRGFRCDAWAGNGSINRVAANNPPFGTPPNLTWMYPRDCPAGLKAGSECRMGTIMRDLFPNITWNIWSIRCWTYWSGSFKNGLSRAFNLPGVHYQTLAGARTYEMLGDGLNFNNYAPIRTRFASNVYQLLVLDWVALGPLWNRVAAQIVWDGNVAGNATDVDSFLTTDSGRMILPPSAAAPYMWQNVTSAR